MNTLLRKLTNGWTVLVVIGILTVIYLSVLLPWMNRWGLTSAQASMPLPGDGTEPGFVITSTRGVVVDAPAKEVWRWVVQLGQERAGFYSNDWLENLVLADIHNADTIRPEWQQHQKGDHVLGAGGMVFQQKMYWNIKAYEEGKMLYLWGNIVVLPLDADKSLLITRSYAQPSSLLKQMTYDWMHFVMEKGMLLGIKARAEGDRNSDYLLKILSQIGWTAASFGMIIVLLFRRRGWGWGLIPLMYATAILVFTRDPWAAMAGFLWWGVIAAGFLAFGRGWWKGLSLATALVVLTFNLAPQPQIAFGVIFLVITLGFLTARLAVRIHSAKLNGTVQSRA